MYTLYTYFRSSASYRVRIALNLKGIKYEPKYVHLLKDGGQQNKEEYKSLNTMGQVPTLAFEGKTLSQSMAIVEYLDEKHPTPRLFPTAPFERAQVIEFCETINSGIQPLHNLFVLEYLEKRFGASAADKKAWTQFYIEKGLTALEKRLFKTAGRFCFGGNITAADIFLIPQLHAAKRNDVNMEKYPIISRINKTCLDLEAFIAASPEKQPDWQA